MESVIEHPGYGQGVPSRPDVAPGRAARSESCRTRPSGERPLPSGDGADGPDRSHAQSVGPEERIGADGNFEDQAGQPAAQVHVGPCEDAADVEERPGEAGYGNTEKSHAEDSSHTVSLAGSARHVPKEDASGEQGLRGLARRSVGARRGIARRWSGIGGQDPVVSSVARAMS